MQNDSIFLWQLLLVITLPTAASMFGWWVQEYQNRNGTYSSGSRLGEPSYAVPPHRNNHCLARRWPWCLRLHLLWQAYQASLSPCRSHSLSEDYGHMPNWRTHRLSNSHVAVVQLSPFQQLFLSPWFQPDLDMRNSEMPRLFIAADHKPATLPKHNHDLLPYADSKKKKIHLGVTIPATFMGRCWLPRCIKSLANCPFLWHALELQSAALAKSCFGEAPCVHLSLVGWPFSFFVTVSGGWRKWEAVSNFPPWASIYCSASVVIVSMSSGFRSFRNNAKSFPLPLMTCSRRRRSCRPSYVLTAEDKSTHLVK